MAFNKKLSILKVILLMVKMIKNPQTTIYAIVYCLHRAIDDCCVQIKWPFFLVALYLSESYFHKCNECQHFIQRYNLCTQRIYATFYPL